MSDLLIIYFVVGVACAAAVTRRTDGPWHKAASSAAITLVLWPLWAPFVLLAPSGPTRPCHRRPVEPETAESRPPSDPERRIDRALQGAVKAARQAGLDELLTAEHAQHIRRIAAQVASRVAELDEQLARYQGATAGRIGPSASAPPPAIAKRVAAAARRRERSIDRLRQLRDREACALEELAELCEAFRAELLLAHYGAAEDLAELKSELWGRLEGLRAIASAEDTAATA